MFKVVVSPICTVARISIAKIADALSRPTSVAEAVVRATVERRKTGDSLGVRGDSHNCEHKLWRYEQWETELKCRNHCQHNLQGNQELSLAT
jgi:hypothetical protein